MDCSRIRCTSSRSRHRASGPRPTRSWHLLPTPSPTEPRLTMRSSADRTADTLRRRRLCPPRRLPPDVLEPEFGPGGDELPHECETCGIVEQGHPDAVLGQPIVTAMEVPGFADHHVPDAELPDQARAVPAG